MNESFNEAVERLELLTEELTKIKRALNSVSHGIPFNEAWDDEVFMEKSAIEECEALTAHIIEHLFKLAFCSSEISLEYNKNGWSKEIKEFQSKIKDNLMWNSKKQKTSYFNAICNEIDDIYEKAIKDYKDDANEYPDLVDGIKRIPEECPWTIEELITKSIKDLLSILLDKKEE